MKDFNSYTPGGDSDKESFEKSNVAQMAAKMMGSFNGKSEADLMKAIYQEAEKNRKAGTLSDAEWDNFYNTLSPMLDAQKRNKLAAVICASMSEGTFACSNATIPEAFFFE